MPESIPISIEPQIASKPEGLKPREPAAVGEENRAKRDLMQANHLVWNCNRALVDPDYASEAQVREDLGLKATDQETSDKVALEIQERKNAGSIDPATVAQNLEKQLGKNPGSIDPASEEVTVEIARRNGLKTAYQTLNAAIDCVDAANQAVAAATKTKKDQLIAQAQEAARTAKNAANKPGDPTVPLTEAETKQIAEGFKLSDAQRTELEAEEKRVRADYYNQAKGEYNQVTKTVNPQDGSVTYSLAVDANGQKIPVDLSTVYEPLYRAVVKISERKVAGRPTNEALEAIRLLRTFGITENPADPDKKVLLAYTPEQARNNETTGIVLVTAEIEEALATLEANPHTASLGMLLSAYQELQPADPKVPLTENQRNLQHNLATLMYMEVQSIDLALISDKDFPGLWEQLALLKKGDENFEGRAKDLRKKINDDHLIPIGLNIENMKDQDLVRFMFLSARVANMSPQDAERLYNTLDLTEAQIIKTLAHNNTGRRVFSQVFGIDVDALTNEKKAAALCAKNAARAVAAASAQTGRSVFTPARLQAVETAIANSLSEEVMNEIANRFNLRSLGGSGLMLLLLFAPSLQALLGFGTAVEQEPQGQ